MAQSKFFRLEEVIEICGVDEAFVLQLEEERLVQPMTVHKEKVYAPDQVDRVRIAHILMEELRVNLEGVEVALHMREQMIAMQRQFDEVLRTLQKEIKS